MYDAIDIQNLLRYGYRPEEFIDLATIPPATLTSAFVRYIEQDIQSANNPFRVSPFQLVLIKDRSPNAMAISCGGRYYIVVHHRILELVNDAIRRQFHVLFPPGHKLTQIIERHSDSSLATFIFQLLTLYIYNHELAHLNQYKRLQSPTSQMQEEYCDLVAGAKYDPQRHAMEIDADIFAATEVSYSIFGFWQRLPEAIRTTELLEAFVTLFGASVFLLWGRMDGGKRDLYFLDHSHPHSTIRVAYMLDCMTKVLNGLGDVVSPFRAEACQRETFLLAEQLLGTSQHHGLHMYAQLLAEIDNFDAYHQDHLLPTSKQLPFLVQWNRPVPKLD